MLFHVKNKLIANVTEKVRAYYHKMVSLPGNTEKIARGIALGLAFDFLPIPIISIPISYFAARLFRCNPVATVATVIFFKLAVPLFFTLNALTGKLLFGYISGPTVEFMSSNPMVKSVEEILVMGYPFLLGSIVNAIICYFLLYYYMRRWLNRKKSGDV
ncbi:MAG: DUF2062 domain-containing protein [Peptococcaceae bacterium]|nr:DUF2062 domain-containing protein [Peptococcaceae bacterium]